MMHEDVRKFWFGPTDAFRPEWFNQSAEFDKQITERFSGKADASLHDAPVSYHEILSLILLFDQFPRHIHRRRAESYRYDALALRWAKARPLSSDCGPLTVYEAYFYMIPFEHSENIEDQRTFVLFIDLLSRIFGERHLAFTERARKIAVRHRDVIVRFGRFPHRNDILGRTSSRDELEFLAQPGSGF